VRVALSDNTCRLTLVTSALGHTVPEVDLQSLGALHLATVEKSLFSMCTAEIHAHLQQHNLKSIIVLGIEVRLSTLLATAQRKSF
jgi:hypothetical protein